MQKITHRFVESRPTILFTYRENVLQNSHVSRHFSGTSAAPRHLWGGELSSRLFGVWHGPCLFWTRTLTGCWFQIMLDFYHEPWENDQIWLNNMFQTMHLGFLHKTSQGVWLIHGFWNSGCNVCLFLGDFMRVFDGKTRCSGRCVYVNIWYA